MKDINNTVGICVVCQQAKPERVKYPGLLAPLPIGDKDESTYQWVSLRGFRNLLVSIALWW